METKGWIYTKNIKNNEDIADFFNANASRYSVRWYEKRIFDWNAEKQVWECYQRIVGELKPNARK